MRTFDFLTYDVFTDRPFGGNPLGIFPDTRGLDDEEMQAIARELNLSETVFLGPPTAGGHTAVRIFTPGFEVPFAGHPTVGTACYLADADRVEFDGDEASIVLEEKVGPVDVTIRREEGRPTFARLTAASVAMVQDARLSTRDAARIVRLEPDQLADTLEDEPCAATYASAGLPYLVIPVRDTEALALASLDDGARSEIVPSTAPGRFIYLVAPSDAPEIDYRVRMFAPEAGVPEDPATGSAAAALGGYLATLLPDGHHHRALEQGLDIRRPSRLELEVDVRAGAADRITVGGYAVPVTRGTLELNA